MYSSGVAFGSTSRITRTTSRLERRNVLFSGLPFHVMLNIPLYSSSSFSRTLPSNNLMRSSNSISSAFFFPVSLVIGFEYGFGFPANIVSSSSTDPLGLYGLCGFSGLSVIGSSKTLCSGFGVDGTLDFLLDTGDTGFGILVSDGSTRSPIISMYKLESVAGFALTLYLFGQGSDAQSFHLATRLLGSRDASCLWIMEYECGYPLQASVIRLL